MGRLATAVLFFNHCTGAYDQWRRSILENHELARIMVKARGDEPLSEEEKLLFDLLFERLFLIVAVSVQKSFQGTTFQEWGKADVDWFIAVLKEVLPLSTNGTRRGQ
jgi:hypothetical protein